VNTMILPLGTFGLMMMYFMMVGLP